MVKKSFTNGSATGYCSGSNTLFNIYKRFMLTKTKWSTYFLRRWHRHNISTWSLANLKTITKSELQKIKNWLDFNLLSLNITKTKFISFSINKSNQPTYNYITLENESKIESVDKIKYLGVIINMRHHIYATK